MAGFPAETCTPALVDKRQKVTDSVEVRKLNRLDSMIASIAARTDRKRRGPWILMQAVTRGPKRRRRLVGLFV